MRAILLASVAAIGVRAFTALEVVNVVGEDGKVLRINKSDYDADQAEGGEKRYTLHADDPEQSAPAGVQALTGFPDGVQPTAAPAAPNYGAPAGQDGAAPTPPLIDPDKQAVAPTAPSPNQRLVAKRGTGKNAKFYAVDGTGADLDLPGIDKDGYADDASAWAAIMALPR